MARTMEDEAKDNLRLKLEQQNAETLSKIQETLEVTNDMLLHIGVYLKRIQEKDSQEYEGPL